MKRFKLLIILTFSLTITACSINTIFLKDSTSQAHGELSYSYIDKTMPKRYAIDPIPYLEVEANAAILVHAATGDILFEKNVDESLAIASMSKIMTELLVLEAIDEGAINWEDTVSISDYAYMISKQPGYASVHLKQNGEYTVEELFNAMAIRSANGATIALAEHVSGSEKDFVMLMNEKAEELALDHTDFVNSSGLTNSDLLDHHTTGSKSDKNKMSAKDLAMLTKYMVDKYPEVLEITTNEEIEFHEHSFQNSNLMLSNIKTDLIDEDVYYPGVDGLKTGFTDAAGYGFTGTVKIDNKRFISVIIGTEEIEDRFLQTKMLYEAVSNHLKKAY